MTATRPRAASIIDLCIARPIIVWRSGAFRPFLFRGSLPGCSWLDSTQSAGAWTRNERQARALGEGKTASSHQSRRESRAPPSTPPARRGELLSARQNPTRRRTTGINSCGSRHIPIPRAGLGVARIAVPCLLNWTERTNPVGKHHVRHSCTCHRTQPTSRPKSNSCLF